jgi:hypothetical protein
MFNIRKKIIERAINHTKRKVVFPAIESIQSVGFILTDEKDERLAVWKFSETPVQVQLLRFIDQKRRKDDSLPNTIYRSDLNFWKLPPDRLIRSFVESPFDLLINLAGINNDSVTYICAASKAKFKVCYKPFGKIFDLVIDLDEENKHVFMKEIFNTLTNLNNNTE